MDTATVTGGCCTLKASTPVSVCTSRHTVHECEGSSPTACAWSPTGIPSWGSCTDKNGDSTSPCSKYTSSAPCSEGGLCQWSAGPPTACSNICNAVDYCEGGPPLGGDAQHKCCNNNLTSPSPSPICGGGEKGDTIRNNILSNFYLFFSLFLSGNYDKFIFVPLLKNKLLNPPQISDWIYSYITAKEIGKFWGKFSTGFDDLQNERGITTNSKNYIQPLDLIMSFIILYSYFNKNRNCMNCIQLYLTGDSSFNNKCPAFVKKCLYNIILGLFGPNNIGPESSIPSSPCSATSTVPCAAEGADMLMTNLFIYYTKTYFVKSDNSGNRTLVPYIDPSPKNFPYNTYKNEWNLTDGFNVFRGGNNSLCNPLFPQPAIKYFSAQFGKFLWECGFINPQNVTQKALNRRLYLIFSGINPELHS